ncbi:Zinc/iron permease [Cokeromyces recurvatus]|uniref:Zinc/iron permease n=1 Tax=Cokeromyces recurvatus TaxID=90255 RepID=UPI002220E94E|nr:Zinc/iron permease [Cokeromyces recurvatus]KAI7904340.1 Zinc/iron permease [Cokeromyces recurvatus]
MNFITKISSLAIHDNTLNGWFGVLLSSSACIIGASIVFIDKFFHTKVLDSRSFMAASMSLASGVLLFSSLSVLFPQAQKNLNNSTVLYVCYFGGAIFTLLLTRLIHYLMPDAIHACGEATQECHHNEEHHHRHSIREERRKLNNRPCDVEYGTIRSSESHFRFHHDDLTHHNQLHQTEEVTDNDTISECSSANHHNHHESVEQTVENDPKHYYSIGIQTAIAICVHKFPEGLIMFVSSQASTSLGISVAIAMSIHNLTEGFMIALPLYYATQSRVTAFNYAAIMGGLSQPLGALIGLGLIKNITKKSENWLFGIVFGCVSGMMSLITIQSMLPQAIRADNKQHFVLLFFFLGVFLVGLTSILEDL